MAFLIIEKAYYFYARSQINIRSCCVSGWLA